MPLFIWIEPLNRFDDMNPGTAYLVNFADGEHWIKSGYARKAAKELIEKPKIRRKRR